jgi:aspartate kinase
MKTLVLKFGGKTINNVEQVKKIAQYIKSLYSENKIVVVVSAMGEETDKLIELAAKVDGCSYKREMDHLLSTGEIKSASILAMNLLFNGVKAKSLNFTNIGIKTNDNYSNAKVKHVDLNNIKSLLEEKHVVVVPGYQGLSMCGDVTTLGRGGSDTTAVVIAKGLKADKCILFKDVGAIYNHDPKTYFESKPLEKITYKELLELIKKGSKVMCKDSVEIAKKENIPVFIACPNKFSIGTVIIGEGK